MLLKIFLFLLPIVSTIIYYIIDPGFVNFLTIICYIPNIFDYYQYLYMYNFPNYEDYCKYKRKNKSFIPYFMFIILITSWPFVMIPIVLFFEPGLLIFLFFYFYFFNNYYQQLFMRDYHYWPSVKWFFY